MLSKYVAALDFGSNAIRAVIARYTPLGLEVQKKFRFPIRLGDDVFHTGVIPEDKIHNVIEMIRFFQQHCAEYKVNQIVAVGTSALRESQNRKEFVQRCFKATGLRVDIISGEQEARWIWRGVRKALHIENHACVLMDIGGGSVEITVNHFGKAVKITSLPFGTLRLLEKARDQGYSDKEFFWFVRKHCEKGFRDLFSKVDRKNMEFVVGTGGNLSSLLGLGARVFKRRHQPSILARGELLSIIKKLESMTSKQRQKVFSLRPDRADVIIPAAHLALLMMEITHCEEMVIPSVGLRDGLLWSLVDPSKKR